MQKVAPDAHRRPRCLHIYVRSKAQQSAAKRSKAQQSAAKRSKAQQTNRHCCAGTQRRSATAMCFPNVNKAGHTGSTATAVQVPRGGQQLQCVLCKGQGHQDTPPARHHPTRGNAQVCCVLWHVHVSSYSGVLCALACLRLRCVVCFGMSQT